jgi:hypothetical protein
MSKIESKEYSKGKVNKKIKWKVIRRILILASTLRTIQILVKLNFSFPGFAEHRK